MGELTIAGRGSGRTESVPDSELACPVWVMTEGGHAISESSTLSIRA